LTWPFRLDRLPSWLVPAFGVALLDVLVAIWPAPPESRFPPTLLRAVGLNLVVAVAALAAAGLALRPFSRRMAWPAALRRTLRIADLELKALDPDHIKALRSLGYIQ
jgi:hypothetical protein